MQLSLSCPMTCQRFCNVTPHLHDLHIGLLPSLCKPRDVLTPTKCILKALSSLLLQVLETMQRSTFCLVLPGDSASSRRTSEIFMSGCIPVFVGPPYATMPFGDAVDYKATSYFFNVTDHK
jgi:hypothetical protein